MKTRINHPYLLTTLVIAFSWTICLGQGSKNESLTSSAWKEHGNVQWESAIRIAQSCIKEFSADATRIQEKLTTEKASHSPGGAVTEEEKKQLFNRGPLNDVATCHFIIAESNERLAGEATDPAKKAGFLKEAKRAYEECAKLNYAMAWDPNGWFWSPPQKASDRLISLTPAS